MSFPQKLFAAVALALALTLSAAAGVSWYLLQPALIDNSCDDASPSGAGENKCGNVIFRVQVVDVIDRPPDALIRTYSLARLPVDLLRVPLAKDVLTEDFVDYYENHESRLSLMGTARRIAYEHKLEWTDRLVESVFDEPAEVALWRDSGGRLQYFAVAMTRNVLAQAIQTVLPALSDVQARSAGKLQGTDADILLLDYGGRYQLLLVSQGDRVVALSDPGMLLAAENDDNGVPLQRGEAVKLMTRLINVTDESAAVSPLAQHFGLAALPEKSHEIAFAAPVFAFGYASFTPDLRALKLSFDAEGHWQSAARVAEQATWAEQLWSALPHRPGLCAALPVDWSELAAPLARLNEGRAIVSENFADRFEGAAAVCWYQDSRLYTPLFVARLKTAPDEVVAKEFFSLAAVATKAGERGEVVFDRKTGVGSWRGEVASRFGQGDGRNAAERKLFPALALHGNRVFFSPDVALVDGALDVAAKRYPALADSFAPTDFAADTLAFIDPSALAGLLKKEIFTALPRDEEATFRNAADVYLTPRLDALARYPAQRIRLEAAETGNTWRPLTWESARKNK
ncbi:MAG: DUF2138 family protein [Zoogloeaceae bacterium]|jgi:uncharacterized protein YfaA (DUF2138 family)|nr:DUF2138 family protein [Zoogloeaceae bacterium]